MLPAQVGRLSVCNVDVYCILLTFVRAIREVITQIITLKFSLLV